MSMTTLSPYFNDSAVKKGRLFIREDALNEHEPYEDR